MTGIICINKQSDITSFGVVAKVRGITGERKAGHTGTLDPMATGVLPVMLGGATRFLNYLPENDKGYRASFKLGIVTDTLDITGKVLEENEVYTKKENIENILANFRGVIYQVPPMYSAKSVDGKRLYDLARHGKTVDRKPCKVEIKKLELLSFDKNENVCTIDVLCSKGTYVRSLIDDIGKALGCGAVMTELQRTMAMGFSIEDAITLDELQELKDSQRGFDGVVIDIQKMFSSYKKICVSPLQAKRFFNGGELDINRLKSKLEPDEICTVYSDNNEFLGLGQRIGEELKVLRILSRKD